MSLILHLFKKDLRRSYLLLATWLLLILLQWGLTASSLGMLLKAKGRS